VACAVHPAIAGLHRVDGRSAQPSLNAPRLARLTASGGAERQKDSIELLRASASSTPQLMSSSVRSAGDLS
jgi:hypothetical protein